MGLSSRLHFLIQRSEVVAGLTGGAAYAAPLSAMLSREGGQTARRAVLSLNFGSLSLNLAGAHANYMKRRMVRRTSNLL